MRLLVLWVLSLFVPAVCVAAVCVYPCGYKCTLSLPGGPAQPQCWRDPKHGAAPAPPLLDCQTLHNLLHQKQSEPGRSVQIWVVFSIVISNFLPFVG